MIRRRSVACPINRTVQEGILDRFLSAAYFDNLREEKLHCRLSRFTESKILALSGGIKARMAADLIAKTIVKDLHRVPSPVRWAISPFLLPAVPTFGLGSAVQACFAAYYMYSSHQNAVELREGMQQIKAFKLDDPDYNEALSVMEDGTASGRFADLKTMVESAFARQFALNERKSAKTICLSTPWFEGTFPADGHFEELETSAQPRLEPVRQPVRTNWVHLNARNRKMTMKQTLS